MPLARETDFGLLHRHYDRIAFVTRKVAPPVQDKRGLGMPVGEAP